MNFFNINLRKLILWAFIISLPLITFNTERSPNKSEWYDQPFALLASVSVQAFYGFSSTVKETTAMYLNLIGIKRRISALELENSELKARLLLLDELQKENDRLRSMFQFQTDTRMNLVAAQVISQDLMTDHSTIQINKGTADGLTQGLAVITTEGVVGYVFRPQRNTSHVMLITDRYSVVDGIIARSRARGLVEGRGGSLSTLSYVEKSEDVQPGDLIVTSGLDNIFPKGFPVAQVKRVENLAYAVSLRVDLTPVVDPDKVEEVFVILNAENRDLSDRISLQEPHEPQE